MTAPDAFVRTATVEAVCSALRRRFANSTALASDDFRRGWYRAIEAIEADFLGIPMPDPSTWRAFWDKERGV